MSRVARYKINYYSFVNRCSKFSSFNQTLDDSDQWTAFAPIAKLESLDELDQVCECLQFNFD